MNFTKAHLVDILFGSTVATKQEARELVDAFFTEIALCLESGNDVKLAGFGHFTLREKLQRPGRNPQTGQEFVISPRRVVCFYPSHKLKERVAGARRGTAEARVDELHDEMATES